MANLIRLKQVDNPEFSGFVKGITDTLYYSVSNPSGYISSIDGQQAYINLSGRQDTASGYLDSKIGTASGTLSTRLQGSGNYLHAQDVILSGLINQTNADLISISGNNTYNNYLITGLESRTSGSLSGQFNTLSGLVTGTSGVLNLKINSVSGVLDARIALVESGYAATGSTFVDTISNSQTIQGTKSFTNRIGFKQIDILPYSGNYSNPGGQHSLFFTQFIDNQSFYASGYGTITGDYFVTKMMAPNNIEIIYSSMIYTGAY